MSATTGIENLARDLGAQEFWVRRLAAIILDGFVVATATWLLSIGAFPLRLLEFGAVGGLLFYLYTVVLEYLQGQTVGKWLLGLRVVGVGAKADLPALLIREVSKILLPALLLDIALGLVVEKNGRERYLEVLSGTTLVVERR